MIIMKSFNLDISRVDNVTRNPERAKHLMRSYARNIGSQASNETLRNDMISNDLNTSNKKYIVK